MISPSILAPLSPAWEAMKAALFRPFNLNKWMGLGFTAWLAYIGESGCSADLPLDPDEAGTATDFMGGLWAEYATLIVAGLIAVGVLALLISLLLSWLRCRGAFMFLDNVVRQRHEVSEPWHLSRTAGNALFLWTLGFAVVAALSLALALTPMLALNLNHGAITRPLAIGLTAPLILIWGVVVLYVRLFLNDFIVPLMWRHGLSPRLAWQKFNQLFQEAPLTFIGYGLFQAALGILLMLVLFVGGCLTCCCLFVILMLPVVWAIVLLPALLFLRLYSLEFLRQFGPDCDVWAISQPPESPTAAIPPAD